MLPFMANKDVYNMRLNLRWYHNILFLCTF